MNKNINVRKATITDVPAMFKLIQELALFEKAPDEVSNTIERMNEDGFSLNKIYDAFVLEAEGEVVGTAITYFRYSTWKGKSLYLEDLIITEKHRRLGLGSLLFNQCIDFGKSQNCSQMNWQVLDWNTPAVDFYKKYNASLDGEWINGTIPL